VSLTESPPSLKRIIESILFAADHPVSARELVSVLPEFSLKSIKEVLTILQTEYHSRGIEIAEVGGGYRMQTSRTCRVWVSRIRQTYKDRMSRATQETLAIIAYKQPVSRAEVEQLRGVDSSASLRYLLDRKLIRIAGRKETPGRPLLYGTTRAFLEFFELKDLSCLPVLKEAEDLTANLSLFQG